MDHSPTNRSTAGRMAVVALGLAVAFQAAAAERKGAPPSGGIAGPRPLVSAAVRHDRSPPLLLMVAKPFMPEGPEEHEVRHVPKAQRAGSRDPVRQSAASALPGPALALSFDGLGQGFAGPEGSFEVMAVPPDAAGDVGRDHYVQIVNGGFAVFDKQGQVVYGPVATQSLWTGFGGGCELNNDGDGVVLYDSLADRWFITQFSINGSPELQCVAVSSTGDPTGSYHRYAFAYADTPDYGKFGLWPDAYYATFNLFRGFSFVGGLTCAYDRERMLSGEPASQQCFLVGDRIGGLLPADLDGPRPPPAGAPGYIATFDHTDGPVLQLWTFHVDWADSGGTRFTREPDLPVADFELPCPASDGLCVPQPGTTTLLDSLGDRLMFRLAYRNQGTHEALVLNHTVSSGGGVGIRWYELRASPAEPGWSVFQQGTYAPGDDSRWMGSIAMDGAGNIALGFSRSSADSYPGLAVAGRQAADDAGALPLEATVAIGGGAQVSGISRWGDYSSMSLDPDDCTFWFTGEYIQDNGFYNWSTRVTAFRLPGCSPLIGNDFSIAISPERRALSASSPVSFEIATLLASGAAESATLSVAGLPPGVMAAFAPPVVTTDGGASTLTLTVDPAAPATTLRSFNVVAEAPSAAHIATASVEVLRPPTDFTMRLLPASQSVPAGTVARFTVEITLAGGSPGTVSLSTAGLPEGVAGLIEPAVVPAGDQATLTISAAGKAGSFAFTVLGASDSTLRSAEGVVDFAEVQGGAPNDFSLAIVPGPRPLAMEGTMSFEVVTAPVLGAPEPIELGLSGLPPGLQWILTPSSVRAGDRATLLLSAGPGYDAHAERTLVVTGVSPSATHAVAISIGALERAGGCGCGAGGDAAGMGAFLSLLIPGLWLGSRRRRHARALA